jgi:hypothetical protein
MFGEVRRHRHNRRLTHRGGCGVVEIRKASHARSHVSRGYFSGTFGTIDASDGVNDLRIRVMAASLLNWKHEQPGHLWRGVRRCV